MTHDLPTMANNHQYAILATNDNRQWVADGGWLQARAHGPHVKKEKMGVCAQGALHKGGDRGGAVRRFQAKIT